MIGPFHLPGHAPCPACGVELDGAGHASGIDTGTPPGVGDFTVCVECLAVLQYAPLRQFHVVTPAELKALDPVMRRIVADGLKFAAGFRAFRKARKN